MSEITPLDFGAAEVSPLGLREKIEELEQAMYALPEAQIQIEPKHYFSKGLYAREIFIPKGTTLTGKIHKTEHMNIVSQGDISVMTEQGIRRVKAPCLLISQPGSKRVGYAHEDTVWTTLHATDETDLLKLEETLVCASHAELETFQGEKLCHG